MRDLLAYSLQNNQNQSLNAAQSVIVFLRVCSPTVLFNFQLILCINLEKKLNIERIVHFDTGAEGDYYLAHVTLKVI